MNSSFNHAHNQQRDIKPPILSYIEANDDNSSVSNLSIPTQLPTRIPNKFDELFKRFQIQSTQQDCESFSSLEQTTSFKYTQHKTLKDKESNTPNHNA